jgi:ribosomal protein S18 acetylase RimI-like enzyme/ribosomal protein S27AE
MNVRPAESDDRERIRAITADSLQSSYALSPQQIEMILEEEFSDAALEELLKDGQMRVLVAEETIDDATSVFGFATVGMGTEATIRWLQVDPEARGGGIATALFEHVTELAGEKPIRAFILDAAVEGGTFLEECGLEQSENEQIEIGSEEFAVDVFTEGGGAETPNEPTVTVPDAVTVDGEDRPVDREDIVPGRDAPFYVIHSTAGASSEAYGYFCSECGSTDVSADSLERLECGNCGNTHLADEWDDAYL